MAAVVGSSRRSLIRCCVLAAAAAACARAPRQAPVTPADIPSLEAAARQRPGDAAVRFRLAAAYLAGGRCDGAAREAQAGLQIAADNVLGPLLIGACQERAGRYDLAAETYQRFAERYPRARGVAALHAKALGAARQGAVLAARQALEREAELTGMAPEPATLAVLPVTVSGDTTYRALSRGLAELIVTDLSVIRSVRLLERLQVGALLDEMRLVETGRVDTATAARMGRLLRAERMVQGVASIQSERAPVRLQLSVVAGDGTVRPGAEVTGRFRDLLDLEKQLVLGLGAQLGIQITGAERQRILRQGPRNLAAFLAYSHGLDALDRGDFAGAARHFRDAVRADPGFSAAEHARQAAEATPVVGGAIVTVVEAVRSVSAAAEPARAAVLGAAARDVAPSLADVVARTTGTGGETIVRQTATELVGIVNVGDAGDLVRLIFRLPPRPPAP